METYTIAIPDLAVCSGELIDLPGTYSYLRRQPLLSTDWMTIYNKYLHSCLNSKVMQCLLREFKERAEVLQTFSSNNNRYVVDIASNSVDFFNKVEMFGSMRTSKNYTLFYSLSDKLDYALAYLFNVPLDRARSLLTRNCTKYDVDYLTLSYAFSSGNTALLDTINLNIFTDISDVLDFELYSMLNSDVYTYSIGSRVEALDSSLSSCQKVTIFLLTKITNFYHRLINCVLAMFLRKQRPFIQSNKLVPVSVGTDNLVISSEYQNTLPDLELHIASLGVLSLPIVSIDYIGGTNENHWYTDIT